MQPNVNCILNFEDMYMHICSADLTHVNVYTSANRLDQDQARQF